MRDEAGWSLFLRNTRWWYILCRCSRVVIGNPVVNGQSIRGEALNEAGKEAAVVGYALPD
jgi:hypothetical protein